MKNTLNNQFEERSGSLPPNFIVLGIMLILISISGFFIFLSLWQILVSVILAVIGGFLFFIREGLIIDFENKKMRFYWSIFSYKNGRWKSISDVKYLSLVRVKMQETFSVRACSSTFMEYKYKLNLICSNNQHSRILIGNFETLKDKALIIAKGLNVKIYDNSEKEKQWIQPE